MIKHCQCSVQKVSWHIVQKKTVFSWKKKIKLVFLRNSKEVLSDAQMDKRTLCRFIYYLFKCARKKNHSKPVKLFQLKNHIPLAPFLSPNFPFFLSIVPPFPSLSLSSFSPPSKSCTLFLALESTWSLGSHSLYCSSPAFIDHWLLGVS